MILRLTMTGKQICKFNLTTFFVKLFKISSLLHKPELYIYFYKTTTLIGPLSAIIGDGIVRVIYD